MQLDLIQRLNFVLTTGIAKAHRSFWTWQKGVNPWCKCVCHIFSCLERSYGLIIDIHGVQVLRFVKRIGHRVIHYLWILLWQFFNLLLKLQLFLFIHSQSWNDRWEIITNHLYMQRLLLLIFFGYFNIESLGHFIEADLSIFSCEKA